MTKNTFFIRAEVNAGSSGASGLETEIDIGAYTDLGSSKPEILRIHKVMVMMTDAAGEIPTMTGDTADTAGWQLTTQSASSLLLLSNRSVIAAGRAGLRNPDSAVSPPSQDFAETFLAQDLVNGYLVAVPSLFLQGFAGGNFTEAVVFSILLECSTEPVSKTNAINLAISQM
jgi:hypothetical protein